ncbi:hypothetical protein CDD83_2826 [Cordyceps sp. RAO-2017]|nr:hypothetical protein CDD83_2826 [Cordyceps sp. RAO-2017]
MSPSSPAHAAAHDALGTGYDDADSEDDDDDDEAFPATGDTIYALSTGHGRAGIAVIRISGPSCLDVYKALCPAKALPRPRCAAVRTLWEPEEPSRQPVMLDAQALVLYFPAPASVTGEDVLELHVHGGPATVKATLAALSRCRSRRPVRYAEPGEFTKRAFVNDRLDLGQVEALSDTLAAETEQQRRAAVRGSSGALGRSYDSWRQRLLLARAELEALIDFSEDQHFDESPSELLASVADQVGRILDAIRVHELAGQRSELLRNGIRIALLGPPNAGKSSLMNLVVGREASIVSSEAGTTRDIVEANLDVRGYLCSFADTAGFRSERLSPVGGVEAEGIRRARRRARESDLVVALASIELGPDGPFVQYEAETLELAAGAAACLVVVNKRDRVEGRTLEALLGRFRQTLGGQSRALAAAEPLAISCKQGRSAARGSADPGGIQGVVEALASAFGRMTDMPPHLQDLLGVTERQGQLLARCRQHLEAFMAEAGRRPGDGDDDDGGDGTGGDVMVAAEYLRYAADCLARITGRGEAGDVEELLGVVFEKFCVGK